MRAKDASLYVFLPLIVLAVVFVVSGVDLGLKRLTGLAKDATTVVAIVSAAAVGIERTLELFWTGVGLLVGAPWPMNALGTHLSTMTTSVDTALQPFYDGAAAALTKLRDEGSTAKAQLDAAEQELTKLQKQTNDLAKTAPDNQQVQLFASATMSNLTYLHAKYSSFLDAADIKSDPDVDAARAAAEAAAKQANKAADEIKQAGEDAAVAKRAEKRKAVQDKAIQDALAAGKSADEANQAGQRALAAYDPATTMGEAVHIASHAVSGMTDFVSTFKDNPGRRLLSLYMGSVLGCALAGLLRLDVYRAILGTDDPVPQSIVLGWTIQWGVSLTGVLIGLGANPTHEAIKALQEYKKSRKSDNVKTAKPIEVGTTPHL
jgi:hypothetical protein